MSHHLSHQPTAFIGRAEELAEIQRLLSNPACQLLTLVGPGGIGKTRLGLEAIRHLNFPDGTYVVSLQAVLSTEHLISAIASAIGLQFLASDEPRQQVLNVLRKKHLLLLLDNFEHLLESADLVSEMIAYAPSLQVMVTSRERLNLSSETVFSVGGMPVPDLETSLNLLDYSAVALFVQSVRRAHPHFVLAEADFPHLIRICRVASGMPLALLLAAAWVGMLPMSEIAGEMERSLEFLDIKMRDLPERHHSIRATFDWSWKLLTDAEREVFRKLSVFRDGFTREGSKAVAGASLKILMELVNKSLVQVKGEGRYDLHELLRQYGEEKLTESPEAYQQARDAHCAWYAALCARLSATIPGPQEDSALVSFRDEFENIRSARLWALEHNQREALWDLIFPLGNDVALQNRLHEARATLAYLLEHLDKGPGSGDDDNLLFTLYGFQTDVYFQFGLLEQAEVLADMALPFYRDVDSKPTRRQVIQAMLDVSCLKSSLGNAEVAQSLLPKAITLSHLHHYPYEEMIALGMALTFPETRDENDPDIQKKRATLQEIAAKSSSQYLSHFYQGICADFAFEHGDYVEAKRLLTEVYNTAPDVATRSAAANQLAESLLRLGEYDAALWYCMDILQRLREIGTRFNVAYTLMTYVRILAAIGQKIRAVQFASSVFHRKDRRQLLMINEARQWLDEIEPQLPAQDFAQAVEWGKTHDIEEVADALLAEANLPAPTPVLTTEAQALTDPLTDREFEVLRLMAKGRSNREIAEALFLALGTVKWYVSDICSKLGVANRTHAVAHARELNLLP